MPLSAPVVTAAAGIGLTWESNPLSGERSGLSVMFGDGDTPLPTLVFLGALLVTLTGLTAAKTHSRRTYAVIALAGALTSLATIGWYGLHITGQTVRAIGMDSSGHLIEPEAATHPGIGWYLTAMAVLTTTALTLGHLSSEVRKRTGGSE